MATQIEKKYKLKVPEYYPKTDQQNAENVKAIERWANSLALPTYPSGLPSGPAGGVLSGTYPNPGLAATVAGDGLSLTLGGLDVNVDGASISIFLDTLGVTDEGITANKVGIDWPSFRAVRSSTLSLTDGVAADVSFTTAQEIFDNGNWHSSTTAIWNVPRTGLYIFGGFAAIATIAFGKGPFAAAILQNGVTIGQQSTGVTNDEAAEVVVSPLAISRCSAGDDIKLNIAQTQGGTANMLRAQIFGAFIGNF